MKSLTTLLIICFLGVYSACHSQDKKSPLTVNNKKEVKAQDTTKQMNLLDEQTKILGQMFSLGGAEADNPFSGTTNYLELIEKTEMPEEQKQEIREIYKLYDMSLDPKRKAEFEIKVNKKLEEALNKAMREQ